MIVLFMRVLWVHDPGCLQDPSAHAHNDVVPTSISDSSAFNRLLTYDCFKPLNLRAEQRKWRKESET